MNKLRLLTLSTLIGLSLLACAPAAAETPADTTGASSIDILTVRP